MLPPGTQMGLCPHCRTMFHVPPAHPQTLMYPQQPGVPQTSPPPALPAPAQRVPADPSAEAVAAPREQEPSEEQQLELEWDEATKETEKERLLSKRH